jgi:hypothetical protein
VFRVKLIEYEDGNVLVFTFEKASALKKFLPARIAASSPSSHLLKFPLSS